MVFYQANDQQETTRYYSHEEKFRNYHNYSLIIKLYQTKENQNVTK